MTVCANNGVFTVTNIEELHTALNAACGEIWLGEGVDSYPCIAILGCDGGASLNYFAEQDGDMYVSVGDKGLRGTLDVNIDGEIYSIERRSIITVEKVIESAEEFLNALKLPECIEWEKL